MATKPPTRNEEVEWFQKKSHRSSHVAAVFQPKGQPNQPLKEVLWKLQLKKKYLRPCLEVSINEGTPKSSILIGSSVINQPFWGTPVYEKHHISANKTQWAEETAWNVLRLKPRTWPGKYHWSPQIRQFHTLPSRCWVNSATVSGNVSILLGDTPFFCSSSRFCWAQHKSSRHVKLKFTNNQHFW